MTSHAALIDELAALRAIWREAARHVAAAAARHPDDDDLAAAEALLRHLDTVPPGDPPPGSADHAGQDVHP